MTRSPRPKNRLQILTDIAGLFLTPAAIDTLVATHAEWATPMGFDLDKLLDLNALDLTSIRRVLKGATLTRWEPFPDVSMTVLPHSAAARRAAQAGRMTPDAIAELADDLASMAEDITATRDTKTLRHMAENVARMIRLHLANPPEYDFSQNTPLDIHRRQNAARHARLSGQDIATALGAHPAGKAPKRAAAGHAARTPPRKARR